MKNNGKKSNGLWKRTSKSGVEYWNGKCIINGEEYILAMFEIKEKKNPNSPDFNIYVTPRNANLGNSNSIDNFDSSIEITDNDISF